MRQAVSTELAPKAVGPYSQGVRAGNLLFVSGQLPFDPATGQIITGGIGEQTRRVLDNIGAILRAAGASYDHVVKTTVFLADLDDFQAMNEVYGRYFAQPAPARATVEVARLPKGVLLEIDAIAAV